MKRIQSGWFVSMVADGKGAWVTRGCTLADETGDIQTLHCTHLTNFALLQVCL